MDKIDPIVLRRNAATMAITAFFLPEIDSRLVAVDSSGRASEER